MMAYLTRPGFNGGGAVSNRTVLPKRKPAAEVKKRKKINYEKIKQYLGKESQELIERELGFAAGGGVNPAQLKQRFMQLVTSIQDADDAEIPSIVAQAKQIREQIDDLNRQLAPDRQIRIGAEGLQFDNPLVDAARIQEAVKPVQGIKPLEAIKSITEDNPAKALVPDFPKGDKGTLADEEEKLDPSKRVAVDPKGSVVQASMKMNTGKTFEKLKNIFKSVEPDLYPEIKTEDEFAEGGSVETPKRGLVDGPGSYSNKDTYAGQPTKLYSSLKDAVTPERYKQIKFANPEMSEKQLEKSYKKLTRSQKYDLISLQKGGGYKNRSGMINPTKSKISEYSGRVKTLKNFKIVEEAGTINPKTKKPFTLEEFLNASPATRRYYLKLASDPIGFRAEIAAQNLKRRDEGKIKVKGYNLTPNALRGERNGLLRFLRTPIVTGKPMGSLANFK